jgi:SNF2 family DNA or RNA helicase
MPGYLLSHNKFGIQYERPIIKKQDKKALKELSKHIRPFILRRMKKDVLKELPPKIESKMIAELTKEQKKVYLAYLQQVKGEIAQEMKEKGFEKMHIKILAALTRLRQICCHPGVFLENYTGDSGKMQLLEEILQETLESGHRVLLFSQFTSMLQLIELQLKKQKIDYFYLDGSVPAQKRGEMVRSFNEGTGQIFLISLKAGGTGLNLTGADTVIHFDPWWNPAVEDQASDRAYRIGQKNAVQVMKLITQGTIEEKIYKLQQKKKRMNESVIQPGETLLSKMDEKEIRELFEL